MPIRELAPDVIAQIAAGEVITRAGDVVKELVENAIDAVLSRQVSPSPQPSPVEGEGAPPPLPTSLDEGAAVSSALSPQPSGLIRVGTISVEIVEGGHGRIQVADDGCGIAADDLPAALRRHATSKIAEADDLQRLASLGFRGEALAAICAVADVSITSAPVGCAIGARIEVADGQPGPVQPQARRTGTTVGVERLFDRVPARRKFQRASSAETAYIGQMLQAYALAYPEIVFSLTCDGRGVLHTLGSGDVRDVAAMLFGPEAAQELLALRDERDPADETVALVGVAGLIGTPALHRATRGGIFLTVNRRPTESRALTYAIEEAYATQIPTGRHPVACIDLALPAAEVDANVHPTKREVRLLRDRLAFAVLQRSVRATLVETIGIPRLGEAQVHLEVPSGPLDGVEIPLFPRDAPAADAEDYSRPRLGGLRILGQVSLTYIICEGAAGLYLVDQHAAHERVVLERLERDVGRADRAQLLLEPVAVALPRILHGALDEYTAALTALGFTVEPFGEGEIVVRAVPAALRRRDVARVLGETHESLDAEVSGPDWRERLALLLSCKTAVKAGQHLEIAEMQSLLDQLDEANLCATCSHGRPTAILLSHSRLEREFGRR